MNWANERTAAAIERFIAPGCQHPSAIEALRCVAEAREAATEAKQAYWIVDAMAHFKDYQLFDDAVQGEKFTAGRKRGSVSPIRKAIARLLAKRPDMDNEELWDSIAKRPPRSHDFYEDRERLIEGPERTIKYPTFRNIASMERRKLKG